jgi:hypothetical protein
MRPIEDSGELRRAIGAREAARARLRRVTGGTAAAAVALGGIFAAFAAGATHPKKAIEPTSTRSRRQLPALTSAPAPPLVTVAPGSASSPTAPATAPTQSDQPPVVSSGGS